MGQTRNTSYRLSLAAVLLVPPLVFFALAVFAESSLPYFARTNAGGQLFCEEKYEVNESFVCQKANGLSSFFYMLLPIRAAWTWDEEFSQFANSFARPSLENLAIVLLGLYLTVGNLGMHGFCLQSGHFLDASSMNLILGGFLAHAASQLCRRRLVFWVVLPAFVAVTLYGPRFIPGDFYLMEFVATIALLVPLHTKLAFFSGRLRCRAFIYWGIATIACFAAAYAFWLHGQDGSAGCEPRSWLQPHAAWHFLTAVSLLTLWHMARSDEDLPSSSTSHIDLTELQRA